MKSSPLPQAFLALIVVLFSVVTSLAESDGPTDTAQRFYDAYMQVLRANGDTRKFVLSSESLTAGFKKAYRKLVVEGMESDPIICGQDYPDDGFEASAAKIDGEKARLTMKSRGDTFKHSFPITLRRVGGHWLISDTNDLKADAND